MSKEANDKDCQLIGTQSAHVQRDINIQRHKEKMQIFPRYRWLLQWWPVYRILIYYTLLSPCHIMFFSSFFISFVSISFFHLYFSFIFQLYWNIIDEYNHKIFKGYICWLGIHTDCEKIPPSKLINIFISSHISPLFIFFVRIFEFYSLGKY